MGTAGDAGGTGGIGGGGGGGAGGYGAVVTGAGAGGIVSDSISGGNGGSGGQSGSGQPGSGGSGGIGLLFTDGSTPTTLTVTGTIQGGQGGAAGFGGGGPGSHGAGGAGLVGANLSITNNGTISGGMSGDGVTRANAIRFTGGSNTLTFGGATSGLDGGIAIDGGTLTFAQPTDVTVASTVSGVGSVIKTGAGTLTLSGSNDYSGATSVLGGRLVSGNSTGFSANSDYTIAAGAVLEVAGGASAFATIGSLSGAGDVVIGLGEALGTGSTNASTTFSGRFLGDGSLEVTGSGTQILSGTGSTIGGDLTLCSCGSGQLVMRGGDLTVGGYITVEAGTLAVEQGARLTSNSSLLVLGTARITGTGSAVTIANDTVVAGELTVAQGGVLSSGAMTTLAGTVLVSGAGSAITTNILAVQSLGFPASLTIAAGGKVASTGGASIIGFAAPIAALVTGAGSTWSVGGGGLSIGPGAVEATTVTVADGGALVLTSGDLQIAERGTLNIGAGGLGGSVTIAAGAIVHDGRIVADFTDTVTLAANILANDPATPGSLIKRGTGTLILTGASTYTGATTVERGRLTVNGSIANSAVTLTGGTLGGSGTVGSVVVGSAGMVAPGNSIGTLTVAGNISFAPGATYQVEVNATGQSDRIAATGTATVSGGTVQLLAEQGSYGASTRYTILTAQGGVIGQFAAVTSNFAFLTPSLAYGANDVALTLDRNAIAFPQLALTRNQAGAAGAAEVLGAGNRVYDALITASVTDARAGFDALSGEAHAQAVSVAIEDSHLIRESILNRLRWPLAVGTSGGTVDGAFSADAPGRSADTTLPAPSLARERFTLWGEAIGAQGRTDRDHNAASLDRRGGGMLFGAELNSAWTGAGQWRLGIAGGYTRTDFDVDGRRSSGELGSAHGALYGGMRFGAVSLRAGAAYAWSDLDVTRRVALPGISDGLRFDGRSATAQAFAEIGYAALPYGPVSLEPFAQIAAVTVRTSRDAETGGPTALQVLGRDQRLGFSTLGLRAEMQLGATPLLARGMLGWRHAFGDTTPAANLAFIGTATPFRSYAAPLARNALVAEAGLAWRATATTTLGVSYSAAISDNARDHALKGRLDVRF